MARQYDSHIREVEDERTVCTRYSMYTVPQVCVCMCAVCMRDGKATVLYVCELYLVRLVVVDLRHHQIECIVSSSIASSIIHHRSCSLSVSS
mmetsp:Transcript_18917/g.19177  ORF Transcript_18917/g.19177 Transcript_18917/m.19177 type:complete len:92 (-) Transcript_18917:632-907(-)